MKSLFAISIVALILVGCQNENSPQPSEPIPSARKLKQIIIELTPGYPDTIEYTYSNNQVIRANSSLQGITRYSYNSKGRLVSYQSGWDGTFDNWQGGSISNDTIYYEGFNGLMVSRNYRSYLEKGVGGHQWSRIDSTWCGTAPFIVPSTSTYTWEFDEAGNLLKSTKSTCVWKDSVDYTVDTIPNPRFSVRWTREWGLPTFVPLEGPMMVVKSNTNYRYEYTLDERGYPIELITTHTGDGSVGAIYKYKYLD